jgi:hypothetical protein
MREFNLIAIHSIMGHEQPAGQAGVHLHLGVGEGGVGHLDGHGVDKAQHSGAKRAAPFHCTAQGSDGQKVARTSQLYVSVVRGSFITQEHRQAGDTLATNDPDLGFAIICILGNHRGKSAFSEIDLLDRFICRFEQMANVELHRLQMGA